MQNGYVIRLLPTKEQEDLFWKYAGTMRWAWNYFIAENRDIYQKYLENGKNGKIYLSYVDIGKQYTQLKKMSEFQWLNEISSKTPKEAFRDAHKAFQKYFNGEAEKPKFKKKYKCKTSFYLRYDQFHKKENGFMAEKIGFVNTCQSLPDLPEGQKYYSNPRISHDGKYWYVSFAIDKDFPKTVLTDEIVGIDVGVKVLAAVNYKYAKKQVFYRNINKDKEVRRLKRKYIREQRRLSRKIVANTEQEIKHSDNNHAVHKTVYKKPLKECRNIIKQRMKIKLIDRRIINIRTNYLHQTSNEIVKNKPSRIVMEKLNITGMMKNRHVAKAIAEQKLYKFKQMVKYKSERIGIEFVEASQNFASSKLCSRCGHKKTDLKLNHRTYKCLKCGMVIDRDMNAAINLANYAI